MRTPSCTTSVHAVRRHSGPSGRPSSMWEIAGKKVPSAPFWRMAMTTHARCARRWTTAWKRSRNMCSTSTEKIRFRGPTYRDGNLYLAPSSLAGLDRQLCTRLVWINGGSISSLWWIRGPHLTSLVSTYATQSTPYLIKPCLGRDRFGTATSLTSSERQLNLCNWVRTWTIKVQWPGSTVMNFACLPGDQMTTLQGSSTHIRSFKLYVLRRTPINATTCSYPRFKDSTGWRIGFASKSLARSTAWDICFLREVLWQIKATLSSNNSFSCMKSWRKLRSQQEPCLQSASSWILYASKWPFQIFLHWYTTMNLFLTTRWLECHTTTSITESTGIRVEHLQIGIYGVLAWWHWKS